jgi:tRNA_anti-like
MKTWIRIVLVIALTLIIGGALVFNFLYNKPHPDFEKMKADYTLAASDLYKAFTADKAGAGTKYNGKVIMVTGILTKTENTDTLVTCVFVFNQGMFGDEGLRCTMLPKYREQAGKIPPGSEIKIKGYCTGFNDSDVILDKCSILNQ